jgi:outer membrane protein TolC
VSKKRQRRAEERRQADKARLRRRRRRAEERRQAEALETTLREQAERMMRSLRRRSPKLIAQMTKAMRDLRPVVGAGYPTSGTIEVAPPWPLPMSAAERETLQRNPQFRAEIEAAYRDPNANLGEVWARWGVRGT